MPEAMPATSLDATFQHRADASLTVSQSIIKKTENNQQLALLMSSICHACKVVSHGIARAGIAGMYGEAGDANASGDDQKKLDVLANDIWLQALRASGVCSVLVSEENEEPIILDPSTEAIGENQTYYR
jgi:fructose-1,6-bisphosphatase I